MHVSLLKRQSAVCLDYFSISHFSVAFADIATFPISVLVKEPRSNHLIYMLSNLTSHAKPEQLNCTCSKLVGACYKITHQNHISGNKLFVKGKLFGQADTNSFSPSTNVPSAGVPMDTVTASSTL